MTLTQGYLLYLIILIAGSLCLLTQFISSQGLHFLFTISWILRSKKDFFIFLTILQNFFQFSMLFENLQFARSLLYSSFHQLLECFMILTIFEFFNQVRSTMLAKSITTFSNLSMFEMFDMSNFEKDAMTSLMNLSSFSLFLVIVLLLVVICFSIIGMVIINRV